MSVLKVDAIQDTSGKDQYTAKAWINFDQELHTIRDDGNVSSVTDYAVGKTGISFTNAMSNSNYSATGMGQWDMFTDSNATGLCIELYRVGTAMTTSLLRVDSRYTNSVSLYDASILCVNVLG